MRASDKGFLIVVAIAAATLGFVGGWSVAIDGSAQPGAVELPSEQRTAEGQPGVMSPGSRPAEHPPAADPAQREEVRLESKSGTDLFSSALLGYFGVEFRRGWSAVRNQPPSEEDLAAGQVEFENGVLALPATIGAEAAAKADLRDSVREALEGGDDVAIVEACAEKDWLLGEDDLSEELLDRVFQVKWSGATVDGTSFTEDRESWISDGMTIEFGPGFHRLDERRLRREDRSTFPEDLTIVGAGMNSTLLTMGDLSPRGHLRRLRIRDLTLDCGDNYFFDLRTGVLTLDLENVRVVRFDMGAGGSLVFGTNRGALVRARGCAFLGGYGRSPGSGNLFRGGALIASFSSCRFARLDLNLSQGQKGKILFRNCVFQDFVEDPTRSRNADFEGSTVLSLITRGEYSDRTPHSLTDFFPNWDGR